MAVQNSPTEATFDDLMHVSGKAELMNGRVVILSPTGGVPNYAAGEIYASLRAHARLLRRGHFAVSDNAAFRVDLPNRKSFSPDAAYWTGHAPTMSFYDGAPVFAVEVRSENDYGLTAEFEMARKRADYFAAGTLVVWDVDLQSENTIRKYTADTHQSPATFRRGEIADAEPAVSGWTFPTADLFF